nr:Mobile element protein [Klebsiella pneumoniae]QKY84564.1 Mobile element protein [Klebsiella pneumoniae]
MILNTIAEKLKRQSKDDFKGRHFEAWLMALLQIVGGDKLIIPFC